MSAAARVSLAQLLDEGALERVTRDEVACRALSDQASRHAHTARLALDADDCEGALQLAYDSCRKSCLALVLAMGLRPRDSQGSHAVTFEAAAAIAQAFRARDGVDDASHLRYVRHGAEYRAETVSVEDADDAIAIADDLTKTLHPRIDELLTQPPPHRARP